MPRSWSTSSGCLRHQSCPRPGKNAPLRPAGRHAKTVAHSEQARFPVLTKPYAFKFACRTKMVGWACVSNRSTASPVNARICGMQTTGAPSRYPIMQARFRADDQISRATCLVVQPATAPPAIFPYPFPTSLEQQRQDPAHIPPYQPLHVCPAYTLRITAPPRRKQAVILSSKTEKNSSRSPMAREKYR